MQLINVVIVLTTLISSAHAGEQKATVQNDTVPIENPPLPRPRPLLLDVTGDNPAVVISAFRKATSSLTIFTCVPTDNRFW